ncbi:MAG: Zn-ribbon domain-containing OB-fold protein [Candidatus Bathyarchaeota archaeon]|nr:MAG: Zn-ribbon domain-containing OB-fold protein [Candidatus Bathyarchaeota archaeon]
MATEKITDIRHMLHWPGHMETDYIYTQGIAGEKFFSEIKENEKIYGGRCNHCGQVFVPPRLYCERCFRKIAEWRNLGSKGVVYTFTVVYIDIDGAKLDEPIMYALITFDGAEGGLIHRLGEIKPHEVQIGMPVEAVFRPQAERTGSINDIRYFKPQS